MLCRYGAENFTKSRFVRNETFSKTTSNLDNVVAGFNEGKYCKELANEYRVDEHSIYKILDKAGIKR